MKQIYLSNCRSSHQRCSVRKSVLINFTKFTGKHLCQSPFFNKKDSGTGVFLWILWNFYEHLFHRTPPDDCVSNWFADIYLGIIHLVHKQTFLKNQNISYTWVAKRLLSSDMTDWRGEFRTLSNICGGAFLKKITG